MGLKAYFRVARVLDSFGSADHRCTLENALADIHDTEQGLFPVLTGGMFSLEASDFVLLSTDLTKEKDSFSNDRLKAVCLRRNLVRTISQSFRLKRALTILNQAKETLW